MDSSLKALENDLRGTFANTIQAELASLKGELKQTLVDVVKEELGGLRSERKGTLVDSVKAKLKNANWGFGSDISKNKSITHYDEDKKERRKFRKYLLRHPVKSIRFVFLKFLLFI